MNILDDVTEEKQVAEWHDEKIKSEGLPTYQVEQTLDIFPVAKIPNTQWYRKWCFRDGKYRFDWRCCKTIYENQKFQCK